MAGLIESNKQIYQPIMKESNMENEKTPLYVAFSTQKGGVGKTTFTVLAASYLYYLKGYDKVVLESSLSFAMAIQKLLVKNDVCRLAGLYLFWNMVDGREKTDLYTAYDKTIKELELPLMKTFIPDTKRYKKVSIR